MITDSLASFLKVSCKNKVSISMESRYRFTKKTKGEKTKRHAFIINFRQNLPCEGLPSPKRGKTCACVRSLMNGVSHIGRFLFSKIQFLVRDDKHVVMLVFAQFGKISGRVWLSYGLYFGP